MVVLAGRAGLGGLADRHLSVPGGAGVAAGAKVTALVAGMVAGADSIADMGLLRHGGMNRLFDQVQAPSTLGTFLRSFRFGHVRQLDAVAARFVSGLAEPSPIISSSEPVTYLDMDDTLRSTFGYAKQGVGFGYSGVKGLNALLATVSTASSAPVIVPPGCVRVQQTPLAAPRGWPPTRSRPPGPARPADSAHGITRIERVMTDNAWAYRWSRRQLCATLGTRQIFIKPHFPWQNGKAERLNRTLATEWAYRQAFT